MFDDVTSTIGSTVSFITDFKKKYINIMHVYCVHEIMTAAAVATRLMYGCEMARKQFQCRKTLNFFLGTAHIFFLGYVNLLLLILCLFDCVYTRT
jgi:hypothetical protein